LQRGGHQQPPNPDRTGYGRNLPPLHHEFHAPSSPAMQPRRDGRLAQEIRIDKYEVETGAWRLLMGDLQKLRDHD
jgi:hypothetical protein